MAKSLPKQLNSSITKTFNQNVGIYFIGDLKSLTKPNITRTLNNRLADLDLA